MELGIKGGWILTCVALLMLMGCAGRQVLTTDVHEKTAIELKYPFEYDDVDKANLKVDMTAVINLDMELYAKIFAPIKVTSKLGSYYDPGSIDLGFWTDKFRLRYTRVFDGATIEDVRKLVEALNRVLEAADSLEVRRGK